jgi:hypothetical protein
MTAPADINFTATSETDSNQSATDSNLLLSNLNAAGVSSIIDSFDKAGAFKAGSAKALKAHLRSVDQFEKKDSADKVVKHLNDFKGFLDNEYASKKVSAKAYNNLKAYADAMIEVWK